jgi:peptidoglycan/xylan/chitin deacetylase (PgdA/CDA1 family)
MSSAASLDLPVNPRSEPGRAEGYPIDFTTKAIDPSWPPPWLAHREEQLHVGTWQWGLGCYERHLAGDGDEWLAGAVAAADHAVAIQSPDGAWPHLYAMPHTFDLRSPWISAMAQGEGASLLVRIAGATGDRRYADAAKLALAPMDRPQSEGGVVSELEGAPFLEEYPTRPPSHVLNGALFAIWGFHDVGAGLGDDGARESFEAFADHLATQVHRFDNGRWSLYDLFPHPTPNWASPAYHVLHINQLRAMQRLAPRPAFEETADRFEGYLAERSSVPRTTAHKAAFRLMLPRNPLLANRMPLPRKRDSLGEPSGVIRPRNDRLILCYHAISETWPSGLGVKPEALREQIGDLLSRGYRGETFRDAVFGDTPGPVFAVTFDDGAMSVHDLALPIMEELGVPATVFLATAFVDSPEPMSWAGVAEWAAGEHRMEMVSLGTEQVRALAAAGWEIGSHTVTHPHLTEIDDESLARELADSRRRCEEISGLPCRSLAYPYGEFDERVAAAARDAGYSLAATLPVRFHPDSPLSYSRVGIYRGDDLARFRRKTMPAMRALRRTPAWDVLDVLRRRPHKGPPS